MKGAKKILVTLVSMFMMVSTFGAIESEKTTVDVGDFNPHYYSDNAIEFVERGIKFYIFLDGEFDFNTAPTAHVDYIYKNGRRTSKRYTPRGIRIERDYQGRIRRVGNVFISYTFDDKIKRIGSVFVKYNHNRMKKVGDLKIIYNSHGIRFIGSVKGHNHNSYNSHYSYGWSSFNNSNTWYGWDTWEYGYYDSFFNGSSFYSDYERFEEDDDFYYYKSKEIKGSKAQKGKIIKRKKAVKSKRNESRKKVATPQRATVQNKRKR